MHRTLRFVLIALVCLINACAQPSMPQGGSRDTTPPAITSSSILNSATQVSVNTSKLTFKFDENIALSNATNILLSPTPSIKPTYKASAKKLVVTFNEPLEENTTYVLNFGESIKDYTEGNPLDSNMFAFSTGAEIDSAVLKGTVFDAFSLKPIENAAILLYPLHVDSALFKGTPYYYSTSDASGEYNIPFLKPGKYQVFGLLDENNNLAFDLPTEKVFFQEGPIQITDSTTALDLVISHAIEEANYVSATRWADSSTLKLSFYKPLEKPLTFYHNDNQLPTRYITEGDTTTISFRSPLSYSEIIVVWGEQRDTLSVPLLELPPSANDSTLADSLVLDFKATNGATIPYFTPIEFSTSSPISSITRKHSYYAHNNDTFPLIIKPSDSSGTSYFIDFDWKEGTTYHFHLPQGVLTSIHGIESEATTLSFTTDTEASYSTLFIELDGWTEQSAIVFLEQEDEVLEKQYLLSPSDRQIVFEHLEPGSYNIRLVNDKNQNGNWDPADIMTLTPAEKTWLMPQGIQTKKGFDFELSWSLD